VANAVHGRLRMMDSAPVPDGPPTLGITRHGP
jgi:hypothetical protein